MYSEWGAEGNYLWRAKGKKELADLSLAFYLCDRKKTNKIKRTCVSFGITCLFVDEKNQKSWQSKIILPIIRKEDVL